MYKQTLNHKMPKQSIKYEYIHHIISIVFVLAVYLAFLYCWFKFDWWHFLIYPITAIAALIVITGFITPVIRMKRISFELEEDFIQVQRGLYFQKRTVKPFDRILYVKLNHGPLSRKMNIYYIEVVTAGSSMRLPKMDREMAEHMRQSIMTKINEVNEDV